MLPTTDALSFIDRILKIIREEGPLTLTQIHNRTNRHFSATEIRECLQELRRNNLIKGERIDKTGGRPAEIWSLK